MNQKQPLKKSAAPAAGHVLHDRLTPREARVLASSAKKRKRAAKKK